MWMQRRGSAERHSYNTDVVKTKTLTDLNDSPYCFYCGRFNHNETQNISKNDNVIPAQLLGPCSISLIHSQATNV